MTQTVSQILKVKLLALPAGELLTISEEEVQALQEEFPSWIPARDKDGIVRFTNLAAKPE